MSAYDVIVVGCGAAGSAAAWRLARTGLRVLALDRHHPPHTFGASHGHTRMTRTAYYEHPSYVPMLLEARRLWRELETLTGEGLLFEVGGLYMGRPDSPLIAGATASARQHGLPVEWLEGRELRRRFPMFAPSADAVGLLEQWAGYLRVEAAVGAMVTSALAAGASAAFGVRVREIDDRGGGGVVVRADDGRSWSAGQVVIAAGPWMSQVCPKVSVRATRQTLGWFWPEAAERFVRLPVWAFDVAGGGLLYGFPMRAERPGLKAAVHAPGPRVEPDAVRRVTDAADEATLRGVLARYVPAAANGPCLAMTVCLYENSPDGHFLLGRMSPTTVVVGGLSGHGFKFAPALGERVAELVRGQTPAVDIDFLHPGRFDGSPPVGSVR